jgi:hypothetical protein
MRYTATVIYSSFLTIKHGASYDEITIFEDINILFIKILMSRLKKQNKPYTTLLKLDYFFIFSRILLSIVIQLYKYKKVTLKWMVIFNILN